MGEASVHGENARIEGGGMKKQASRKLGNVKEAKITESNPARMYQDASSPDAKNAHAV